MRTNNWCSFLAILILSFYLVSCYPKKEVLGRWPDGKPKVVRHHKRNNKFDERFVEYYDNGKKKYVRYWRNDLDEVYKTKVWYKNGAKALEGSVAYKDTGRVYNPADSAYIFKGLCKGYTREWHENGKLKFETVSKDNLLIYNYYNEQGVRTKQEVEAVVRPDGYDTVEIKIVIEPGGKRYSQKQRSDHTGVHFYNIE